MRVEWVVSAPISLHGFDRTRDMSRGGERGRGGAGSEQLWSYVGLGTQKELSVIGHGGILVLKGWTRIVFHEYRTEKSTCPMPPGRELIVITRAMPHFRRGRLTP